MKSHHIVGIDVSKETIDVFCRTTTASSQFANCPKGFNQMVKWLNQQKISALACWFVFENTGLYSIPLVRFCCFKKFCYSMVVGLDIKRSLGIKRGKSDKIDACNISVYAYQKGSQLKPGQELNEQTARLKRLLSLRERFVTQRKGLMQSLKEMKKFCCLKNADIEVISQAKIIKIVEQQILELEDEIKRLINNDQDLANNFTLLTSIKGIGFVIAAHMLAYTDNFTRFKESRKFACYIGTAPFPFSSGTSVRGRTKVSHLANKKLKSLFDLAAKSALQADPELREYYQRRINQGKSKMSTVNIIRNKLLHRIFAVIKRKTPYQIKMVA
jgi:transposase